MCKDRQPRHGALSIGEIRKKNRREGNRNYSKAFRYGVSRCVGLADIRFWIGSKNTWDTRILTKALQMRRFYMEFDLKPWKCVNIVRMCWVLKLTSWAFFFRYRVFFIDQKLKALQYSFSLSYYILGCCRIFPCFFKISKEILSVMTYIFKSSNWNILDTSQGRTIFKFKIFHACQSHTPYPTFAPARRPLTSATQLAGMGGKTALTWNCYTSGTLFYLKV